MVLSASLVCGVTGGELWLDEGGSGGTSAVGGTSCGGIMGAHAPAETGDMGTARLEVMGAAVVGREPFCVALVSWPGDVGSWAE